MRNRRAGAKVSASFTLSQAVQSGRFKPTGSMLSALVSMEDQLARSYCTLPCPTM